jgi:hypothetical protein
MSNQFPGSQSPYGGQQQQRPQPSQQSPQAPRQGGGGGAQRNQMDVETLRGLLIANGGGAVALLIAVSSLLDRPGYESLVYAMLIGIVVFMLGVVLAILFNFARRQFLAQADQLVARSPTKILGITLRAPGSGVAYQLCLYLSLLCFIGTGVYVAAVGANTLSPTTTSSIKSAPGAQKAGPKAR